eukprot:TRINITY_DN7333_c0_g1_i5.p1 TRINITY_DN7333_c0_g1~~TRINITY_DN7333_c0_g1_i5.p1  ORF type:complete len:250 (+),score=36.53 TRINITY_DN7333_c0_g1_i5:472-1221(+)
MNLKVESHMTTCFAMAIQNEHSLQYRLAPIQLSPQDELVEIRNPYAPIPDSLRKTIQPGRKTVLWKNCPKSTFDATRSVEIILLRGAQSGLCGLGRLSIYGVVSKLEHPNTHSRIEKIYKDLQPRLTSHPTLKVVRRPEYETLDIFTPARVASKTMKDLQYGHLENNPATSIQIDEPPIEYLDMITYELMHNPIQLPSGAVVDESTLRRCAAERATDPFTNMPLDTTRLQRREDLRVRIEGYLQARGGA